METEEDSVSSDKPTTLAYVAVGGLVAMLVAHTVFAGQMHGYMVVMAEQLFSPVDYISTVVETPGKMSKPEKGY